MLLRLPDKFLTVRPTIIELNHECGCHIYISVVAINKPHIHIPTVPPTITISLKYIKTFRIFYAVGI